MSEQLALMFSRPSTSSAAGSPARTSARPVLVLDSTAPALGSGGSTSGSSANSSRASSSSRTSPPSSPEGWTLLSPGSPMRVSRWRGSTSGPPMSAPLTGDRGCSSSPWPTATASDGRGGPGHATAGGVNLRTAVAMDWPTPTVKGNHNRKGLSPTSGDGLSTAVKDEWATPLARDWKSSSPATTKTNSRPLSEQVGEVTPGPLNPAWVEMLMGFPVGWTHVGPLVEADPSTTTSRRGRHAASLTEPSGSKP